MSGSTPAYLGLGGVSMRVLQSFGRPRPTTNPYISMLQACLDASDDVDCEVFSWRRAFFMRYDVFHVHWADTLLAGSSARTRAAKRVAFALLLARLRLTRTAVVRTVHNTGAAGTGRVDRALTGALERAATVRIHLSETTPERAGTPSVLIEHGHYRDWFAELPRRERVHGRLVYVGLIKPYKGIDELLDAFADARRLVPQLTLHIAGRPADPGVADELRRRAAQLPGLSVEPRYLDEAEFAALVSTAELVVLPYRRMHNSGAALAALSLDRPVLVPDNPTTALLAEEVGAGWVLRFSAALRAEDLVDAWQRTDRGARAAVPDLSAREWSQTASRHVGAYRLATRRRPAVATGPRTGGHA